MSDESFRAHRAELLGLATVTADLFKCALADLRIFDQACLPPDSEESRNAFLPYFPKKKNRTKICFEWRKKELNSVASHNTITSLRR